MVARVRARIGAGGGPGKPEDCDVGALPMRGDRFVTVGLTLAALVVAGCSTDDPAATSAAVRTTDDVAPPPSLDAVPPRSSQSAWARPRTSADGDSYRERYAAPSGSNGGSRYSITLNRSMAETWRLFRQVAPTRYIRVTEEDEEAGVMVAFFDDRNVDEFVDCGTITVSSDGYEYEGPYARYLKQNTRTDFYTKMTIVMREKGDEQTEVTVDSDYQFTSSAEISRAKFVLNKWEFKTGTQQTIEVEGSFSEDNHSRTCRPTHRAERLVMDSLRAL